MKHTELCNFCLLAHKCALRIHGTGELQSFFSSFYSKDVGKCFLVLVFFPYTCLETLTFFFLLPIMRFTQCVDFCTQRVSEQYTCSVSRAVPVSTNCKLIFLLWSFFSESAWPHLSHKWSFLIRARTLWASNLIFADNSFSTTGVGWLVWCCLVFFFPFWSFCCREKVCLDGFISCGGAGF